MHLYLFSISNLVMQSNHLQGLFEIYTQKPHHNNAWDKKTYSSIIQTRFASLLVKCRSESIANLIEKYLL